MVITFYCAKDPPLTSSKVPIEQLNTLGWAEFSAGNYNGSLTYFNKVLSEYSDYVSANVGKGWLLLMQNHDDLSAIANHLQKGVLDDNWKADARCGLAVTKLIQKQYSYIELDEFVIMPNHIHGILIINDSMRTGHDLSVHKIKSLSSLIGAFKTTSSKLIHQNGLSDFTWQRSFHDHIIRNDKSLNKIREYIRNNPATWDDDKENINCIATQYT